MPTTTHRYVALQHLVFELKSPSDQGCLDVWVLLILHYMVPQYEVAVDVGPAYAVAHLSVCVCVCVSVWVCSQMTRPWEKPRSLAYGLRGPLAKNFQNVWTISRR